MTRATGWLAAIVLGLAGCATRASSDNTPQAQCQRQAYDDPEVKDSIIRANTSLSAVRIPALMEQDQLVRRATQRCLAALGLAPKGGVEAVKPY